MGLRLLCARTRGTRNNPTVFSGPSTVYEMLYGFTLRGNYAVAGVPYSVLCSSPSSSEDASSLTIGLSALQRPSLHVIPLHWK